MDEKETVMTIAAAGDDQNVDPRQLIDSASFRLSMRHPASSVTIVASGSGESRAGLTATAVCSLSDEPASILVCVNQKSFALNVIRETGVFSVNFLNADQTDVAGIFAGRTGLRGAKRFDDQNWTTLMTGAPVLKRCLAAFDCYLDREIDYATHTILIGHVATTAHSGDMDALVYAGGEFMRTSR
jgi:flavin reductase (DIM6/NTAB) family NADH-FMN oxidoreductase RutF